MVPTSSVHVGHTSNPPRYIKHMATPPHLCTKRTPISPLFRTPRNSHCFRTLWPHYNGLPITQRPLRNTPRARSLPDNNALPIGEEPMLISFEGFNYLNQEYGDTLKVPQVAQRSYSLHNQLFTPTQNTRKDVYLALEVLIRCSPPMKEQAPFTWSPPMLQEEPAPYVHPVYLSVSNCPLAQFLLHLPPQVIPLSTPHTTNSSWSRWKFRWWRLWEIRIPITIAVAP